MVVKFTRLRLWPVYERQADADANDGWIDMMQEVGCQRTIANKNQKSALFSEASQSSNLVSGPRRELRVAPKCQRRPGCAVREAH